MFQYRKLSAALTMYLHITQDVQQQRNLRTTYFRRDECIFILKT